MCFNFSAQRLVLALSIVAGSCLVMGCSMKRGEVDRLTRQWILVWNDGDPESLPLAEDFTHTSPYGRIEGRERYLAWVLPMAQENVAELTIEDVMVSGNESVVRYQNRLASGATMRACDWLTFYDGELTEVRAYYERPRADGSNDYGYDE